MTDLTELRLLASLYLTAGDAGTMQVAVWLDKETSSVIPFSTAPESWRGWDGEELSDDERRYVSAALAVAAMRISDHDSKPTDG